ncbi:MFS transporter [Aliidongia dinghuensis]|uniref:MFS transporter n=1 Tax=Aliidongia dinghuensis TaxID=1867774 RepID=A0A8J2YZD4_9PROT|nr:MFS transporter [Aliidongia dinghuensis]GGF36937.1 MFS transporter [Aliidongia dinghuensis]
MPDGVKTVEAAPASTRRPLQIALLVAAAFFMENLDGTVIATALPQMARSFAMSAVDLNLGMTAYLLTLAVFIPASGWFADRFGARTVLGGAILGFTVASVFCAMANGLWEFTAARVLQGIAGAMMVPVGRLVVVRATEKRDLMRMIGIIVWPGLVAPVIGPPLGGFITTYASWRWIFLLNVPLGLAGLVLAWLLIRNERGAEKKPFDWLGFGLGGGASLSFMYGIELLGRQDAAWAAIGGCVGVSVVLGVLAWRHARRHAHPLLDLSALKIPSFAVAVGGGSLFRIAISTAPFLLPLLFQVGFGMDAFHSGLLVLALFAGNLTMKTVTNPLLRRFGFRTAIIGNGLVVVVAAAACAFFTPATPWPVIAAVLFVNGLCRSMQFTSLTTLSLAEIPGPQVSGASTLSSMVQQMTMGMGIAFGALALRVAAFAEGNATGVPTVTDFRIAFGLVAALALAALFDVRKLAPDAGAEVSGHRRG